VADTIKNDEFEDAPRLTSTPYERAPLWAACRSPRPMPIELPRRAPVTAERFNKRIDDIKSAGEHGLSDPGEELLELMVAYAPPGTADSEEAMDQLVESALLIETAHPELSTLADALRRGLEIRPTAVGDLVGITTRVLSPTIVTDLVNVRGEARHGANARRTPLHLVPPVAGEYDTGAGERCIELRGPNHFMELWTKQREALGFTGSKILDLRNRADLENVAAQGVQKPLTIAVTRLSFGQPNGRPAAILAPADGSRRTNEAHWGFERMLPDLGASTLGFRHLTDGFGQVAGLAPFTEETAMMTRDVVRAAIAAFAGPGLSGNKAKDTEKLAEWAAGLSGEEEVLVRLLTVPAFIIIGVDYGSVGSEVENPMTECIRAYTTSLHVKQQAELEWDDKAILLDVGRSILRQLNGRFAHLGEWAHGLLFDPDSYDFRSGELALTSTPEIATQADPGWTERASKAQLQAIEAGAPVPLTLIEGLVPAVDTGGEAVMTKLEVMAASTAAIVARGDHEVNRVCSEALVSRGLPNSPKQRAQVWAGTVLGLVGLPLEGSLTARAFAALSRTPTHSVVWQLSSSEDPLGEIDNWTDLIGLKFEDLVERSDREADAIVKGRRNPAEDFGPAQILLALYGAYAQIVNPALLNDETHQLTISGLGQRHGPIASEPMVIALNLAKDHDGRRQLFEMIVALVNNEEPCLPRSVRYDPERHANRLNDGDENRYGVVLTEFDLRGSTFWPDRVGEDGSLRDVPLGALSSNERFFKDMATRLGEFAKRCKEIADPRRASVIDPDLNVEADEYRGSVTSAFLDSGVDIVVANAAVKAVHDIDDVVRDGRLIRIQVEGNSDSV
jgi:hypothetical protein